MYPIKLGFGEALKRIDELMKNEHFAEALVTSVFTMEKLMRRSLRVAILARGFTATHAENLLDRKGQAELQKMWAVFDRLHRTLPSMVGNNDWQHVKPSVEMRNKLVHGHEVFTPSKCKANAEHMIKALKKMHETICNDYGTDPWATLKVRTSSKLGWHTVRNASSPVTAQPTAGTKTKAKKKQKRKFGWPKSAQTSARRTKTGSGR